MPSQATRAPAAVPLANSISKPFETIIECIEFLQLSKSCEQQDFGRFQVRLDTCKLRLTRLGVTLGVLADPETGSQRKFCGSPEKVAMGQRYFEVLLEDIMAIARRSKTQAGSRKKQRTMGNGKEVVADDDGDDDVHDVTELEQPVSALHKSADGIVSKRLQRVEGKKKERWPLYEKHHFEGIVGEISSTVSSVEDLFPETLESQKLLCIREVKELQQSAINNTALVRLQEASKENKDTMLASEVHNAIMSRGSGHRYGRTEVETKAVLMQGDYIARGFVGHAPFGRVGHYYATTVVEGGARVRQGDSYGGNDL